MLQYFNEVFLEILNVPLRTVFADPVTYCELFDVEKFCGFHGSIGKRKTFTVKHFHLVLKMAGHSPGPSLKNSCDLLSALGKVFGIMLQSSHFPMMYSQ